MWQVFIDCPTQTNVHFCFFHLTRVSVNPSPNIWVHMFTFSHHQWSGNEGSGRAAWIERTPVWKWSLQEVCNMQKTVRWHVTLRIYDLAVTCFFVKPERAHDYFREVSHTCMFHRSWLWSRFSSTLLTPLTPPWRQLWSNGSSTLHGGKSLLKK